jgi:hypothetical protein
MLIGQTTKETTQILLAHCTLDHSILIASRSAWNSTGKWSRHWYIVYLRLKFKKLCNYILR